jgi:hypothetical protein
MKDAGGRAYECTVPPAGDEVLEAAQEADGGAAALVAEDASADSQVGAPALAEGCCRAAPGSLLAKLANDSLCDLVRPAPLGLPAARTLCCPCARACPALAADAGC